MLSILITIYNYNLFPLVEELYSQCISCNIDFEILTQDDASNSTLNIENEKINSLPHCSFFVLKENVGYRENKNILVQKSKYDLLLILDGDCKIDNPNFIKNYLNSFENFDGVYGGRIHPEKPFSPKQTLRWKYGKFMEDQSIEQRNKSPYRSFLFNNTLIRKEIFNQVKFDNSFKKYGHDDTLFSFELKKINARLKHIENPVIHDDIDSNIVFYNKTKHSLENLFFLYTTNKIDTNHSKMITLFEKLKLYYLVKPISLIYSVLNPIIEKNLTGNNPKLFWFNVFRLGYFCKLASK
ncbi:glycosyltransferase family 2 protein [Flavobacterium okayamense]|uniref:Glycosyl transferase n=1 Tax=Flavobacterium okayamense TaxID=2830782 RepID=A0ABM7S589_9FLAO|nr:glycosyltransferase [Flavobacterium okayamense]BCY28721.1 glycosyl transferase [Flavobacterium okayamense]